MTHSTYELFMTILTLFILYADDIRILIADKESDSIFYMLLTICVSLFLMEIILFTLVRKDYIFSFFFWMDIIATLTSLLEIPIIMRNIF